MGFFSKIKENLQKGGVKVAMEAPDSINKGDEMLPVSLSLTANGTPRNIQNIKVELVRHWSERRGDDMDTGYDVLFSFPVPDSTLTINAQETRTFSVQIPLSAAKAAEIAPDANPLLQTAAKVVDSLSRASNLTNHRDYDYKLKCIADVEGIALDPTASKNMQVYKENQWKISF